MKKNYHIEKFNRILLLSAILCIALVLVCGIAFYQNNSAQTLPSAYAANQPIYSMGTVVTFDTNLAYDGNNPETCPDYVYYYDMSSDNSGDITAAFNTNKLTVVSTSNKHLESLYADLNASITVPAWYEYEVEYVFKITFGRVGGQNGAYYDFYDFDSDSITGKDVGFAFVGANGGSTLPQTYTKVALVDERNRPVESDPYIEEYRVTKTYTNESNNAEIMKQNFGTYVICGPTTSLLSYIKLSIEISSSVQETKLSVTKPTKDTTIFAYNGSSQTYKPNFPTLTDQTRMTLVDDSDALTQTNAGTYKIKYQPIAPYPWDDGSFEPVELEFVILKGDLNISIDYDGKGNSRYLSAGLPSSDSVTITGSDSGISGTFSWNAGQTPSTSNSSYKWTFTPNDQDNWNIKTGTETITFIYASVQGLVVEVTDSDIYDRFDTGLYSSLDEYLKQHISVKVKYSDGSTSAPLNAADFLITNDANDFLVTVGGSDDEVSDTKTVKVRVTSSDQALRGLTGQVDVTVKKAIIKSMVAEQKLGAQPLKYPVTLDQIKDNFEVYIEWNFFNRALTANESLVSVAVEKDDASNPDGVIKAGNINLVFTYSDNGLIKTATFKNYTILKGDIDMSGVTFADKTETYDGNAKGIEISGALPAGVTGVSYTSTGDNTGAGTYTITATFAYDSDNYNPVSDMTAELTINKADYDITGITFEDDTVLYDGNSHTLTISGNLPDGVSVTYTVEGQTATSFTEPGTYLFTATFGNPDSANYNDIAPLTAELKINPIPITPPTPVDKPTLTVSSQPYTGEPITFELNGFDSSFMYITGELTVTDAGQYSVTIGFKPGENYCWSDDDSTDPITLTFSVIEQSDVTPAPTPSNGSNIIQQIKDFFEKLIEAHFPLWQICTMAVAGLLALIFLIKSIQYGNRRKKIKGETKKLKAKTYSAILPVFSTELVLAGLSNQVWSIMAFAFVGLAVLMFVIALITRRGWKKAELAKETTIEEIEERKESKQLALQEKLVKIGQVGGDTSAIEELLRQRDDEYRRELEAQRREDEARRREEEARHREEIEALREEQSKRDEAMKIMLAGFMGRSQDDSDMPLYGSIEDTDLLVQKVIAGLLPAVQQMIPDNTAYLTAPAYENNPDDIDAIADRVAEKLSANMPVSDQSDEIKALTAEMKGLKKQLAKEGKEDINVDDIVQRVTEQITPAATTVVQGASIEEVQALNAQIAKMQQKIDSMAFVSADEYDDGDFDDEEEWDSVLDEEDDDFVESVIIEADGTVKKTSPNFRMRLKQSSDKNREWYAVVKNMFCSQKGVTYRVCKRVEKIRYQGQVIAVIGIAKRSIKLWLALKPYEYDARRYHHKDVSDKPRFIDVPMYVRVSSDRALTRAQELILALFQELNMEEKARYSDRGIQELIFTLKHNRLLSNKQTKGLLCEVMHVHDCDVLDDETAKKCIESKNADFIDDSMLATVKIDDMDAKFQDGNRVTLERLKKVGLVSEECTGYTVTADIRLTKPLIIVANDFTLTAVKLIALTGGRAIKLNKV